MTAALTPKQERFALAYVRLGDASAAYRDAYAAARKKPQTVNRNAHALTRHNKVAARLAELQAELVERSQVTAAEVVRELWDIATDQEAHAGARVSALTVLARHTGVIADGATVNLGGDHREIHLHFDGGPRDDG